MEIQAFEVPLLRARELEQPIFNGARLDRIFNKATLEPTINQDDPNFNEALPSDESQWADRLLTLVDRAFEAIVEIIRTLVNRPETGNSDAITNPPVDDLDPIPEDPTDQPIDEDPISTVPQDPKSSNYPLRDINGFLWKPSSDKNGNTVVLLPPFMDQTDVIKVELTTKNGRVLEEGVYHGGGNPISGKDRLHYRFAKPGINYPAGTKVKITFSNDKVRHVPIPETGKRYEPKKEESKV